MSKSMQKCYNVSIIGRVQDVGFRAFIEGIAKLYKLKGYAFNDIDGSVKMVCCGENSIVSDFFKEIRIKGEKGGVIIEDIVKEEIPFHIHLPEIFSRLYTDELADIGRKLDKGNELLGDIKKDASALPEIKDILGSFVIEQREFNKEQRGHNQRLEKILEKLAEK